MVEKLYNLRFELFLFAQLSVLFGSLIVPNNLFQNLLEPALFILNISTGILLVSKNKKFLWFCLLILGVSLTTSVFISIDPQNFKNLNLVRFAVYFVFFLLVTYEVINQVWKAVKFNKKIILGLICGLLSLGFIGFFIFMSIEIAQPQSFTGGLITIEQSMDIIPSQLMYFSFITLMTVGYGDILPTTVLAQKATILVSLIGQLYIVIVTAVVVGKYIAARP